MSGPVSYLQPGSPAADKIEVEMKLDGPEQPRRAGEGAALRPPWAAAPSAVALGAALGRAGAMKREAGRADRPIANDHLLCCPGPGDHFASRGSGTEMEVGDGIPAPYNTHAY